MTVFLVIEKRNPWISKGNDSDIILIGSASLSLFMNRQRNNMGKWDVVDWCIFIMVIAFAICMVVSVFREGARDAVRVDVRSTPPVQVDNK